MIHTWYIIVNPTSGMGRSKRNWGKINKLLHQYELNFEFQFSEYSKHETILVKEAIRKGYRKIISIGGDGTLFNILNGVMTQEFINPIDIEIGVIPIGTGNDWTRSHKIPRNFEKAIQIIKEGKTVHQDVGYIELLDENKSAYFNILAGSGFVGHVVHKTNKIKKIGPFAFALGTLLSLAGHKLNTLKIHINEEIFITQSLLTVVGNLKYSGGGMQLTKNANSSDGLFDVTIAKHINKPTIIGNIFNLFNGKIVNHRLISNYKTDKLKIEIKDNTDSFVQADGEMIGKGGFQVSLIPQAVTYIVPSK
ncbi:MAG: diacylglycerol kinase family lipid kinase [Flavobacteriaceae bacterium]|nr:diacylglycerol kinase family lipid kinase [Flavobacteriaceae bacterium]